MSWTRIASFVPTVEAAFRGTMLVLFYVDVLAWFEATVALRKSQGNLAGA